MGNVRFVHKLTALSLRGGKQMHKLKDHLFSTDSSKSTYLSKLFGFLFKLAAFSSRCYTCVVLTLVSSVAIAARE